MALKIFINNKELLPGDEIKIRVDSSQQDTIVSFSDNPFKVLPDSAYGLCIKCNRRRMHGTACPIPEDENIRTPCTLADEYLHPKDRKNV